LPEGYQAVFAQLANVFSAVKAELERTNSLRSEAPRDKSLLAAS